MSADNLRDMARRCSTKTLQNRLKLKLTKEQRQIYKDELKSREE